MKTIRVYYKNVYGNELCYPKCETAKKLVKLTNSKTFTHTHLNDIRSLGYEILVEAEQVDSSPFFFTKKSLFLSQAPMWNFELNEDQILEKALEVGFVTKVGVDEYLMNETYGD